MVRSRALPLFSNAPPNPPKKSGGRRARALNSGFPRTSDEDVPLSSLKLVLVREICRISVELWCAQALLSYLAINDMRQGGERSRSTTPLHAYKARIKE